MDDSVGFRFHPTEQEMISYFLERKMCSPAWPSRTIHEVKNICKFEPWDLPKHSPLPPDDRVWYFFNVHSNRTSRTTNIGYWKVTGNPRPIRDKQGKKEIGYRKILVFHRGRHPNGVGTKWVMHEYRSSNVPSNKASVFSSLIYFLALEFLAYSTDFGFSLFRCFTDEFYVSQFSADYSFYIYAESNDSLMSFCLFLINCLVD
ncbi:NAC domain containing protein [Melia azedarach]|uniref:NAC domain containing protein n=1 Tax=Melia azedarach TaxID=155640 RepID=A0ACC1YWV8_MELAZ|nr:NAC domain containing protein [Melia azedarach]